MTVAEHQTPSHGPSHVCPHPLGVALVDPAPQSALPWHMWAVGALTLCWYALGLGQLGLMDTAPQATSTWSQAALALCLCSGFGGAALLLMRSRYAVQAMVVALLGVMAASLEMFAFANLPVNIYANPPVLALWLIAQVSLLYALRVNTQGFLR